MTNRVLRSQSHVIIQYDYQSWFMCTSGRKCNVKELPCNKFHSIYELNGQDIFILKGDKTFEKMHSVCIGPVYTIMALLRDSKSAITRKLFGLDLQTYICFESKFRPESDDIKRDRV